MFQRKTFVSALLVSAIALPAFAQDAAPAAPSAPAASEPAFDSRTAIEEITITSRKVTENLQDSPLAVSAFGAESLEGLGIGDTQDISSMAPNLYLTQTPGSVANLALSIRGVAGAEPLLTREQGVAIYMDDVYIARVTGAIMDLVDVERVEVLRGPQGTLYGRNSTGGAVRFISRKPTEEFGFSQRIGSGSWSRFASRTVINTGELLPGFAASLAYFHDQKDGYRNNTQRDQNSDYGAKNTDAFRIALGWDATETLALRLLLRALEPRRPRPGLSARGDRLEPRGRAHQRRREHQQSEDLARRAEHRAVHAEQQGFREPRVETRTDLSEHTIRGHNLSMGWDLGFTNFTGIVSYRSGTNRGSWNRVGRQRTRHRHGVQSATVGGARLVPGRAIRRCRHAAGCLFAPTTRTCFSPRTSEPQDQWSLETRFDGDLVTEALKYVAGFYYFNEDFSENNPQHFLFPVSARFLPSAGLRGEQLHGTTATLARGPVREPDLHAPGIGRQTLRLGRHALLAR